MKFSNQQRPLRVLIADGHPLFRLGVSTYLQQSAAPRMEIAGEANDGERAVAETARLQPDVVLLDACLPGLSATEVTRQILRVLPKTRILALSPGQENPSIAGMVRAGAVGYLVKSTLPTELCLAICAIAEGHTYFSRDVTMALTNSWTDQAWASPEASPALPTPLLTKREWEILHFVAEEKSNQEIAQLLFLSPRTVETHKRNMLLKLKMKNVAGLVRYYLQTAPATGMLPQ